MREHWRVEGPDPSRAPGYPGAPARVAGPSPASPLADVRDVFKKLPGWHQESFETHAWRLSVIREESAGETGSGLSSVSSARMSTSRSRRRRGFPPQAGTLPSRAGKTHLTVLPVAFLGPRAARKSALRSTAGFELLRGPRSRAGGRATPKTQCGLPPATFHPRLLRTTRDPLGGYPGCRGEVSGEDQNKQIGDPIARNLMEVTLRGVASRSHVVRRRFLKNVCGRQPASETSFLEKFLHGKDFARSGSLGPQALRSPGKSRKALEWKVEG
jgi:hypothetical protein